MRKVLIGVVAALVVLGVVVYWVFFRPSVPLHLRFPATARPGDCFADAEGSGEGLTRTVAVGASDEEVELPFDLTGTWALKEVSSTLSNAPIIGDIDTITTAILRVEMQQRGNRLAMSTRDCLLDSVTSSDASQVIIPRSFLDAMEPGQRQAVVEPTDTGYRFRQLRFTRVLGVQLEDPVNDPLPDDEEDSRIIDADGDGHPGLTVRIEGLVDGEIYLVQRNWNELCGDVISPDRIEGYLWWSSQQEVLGASNFLLNRQLASIPNPDWERNRFLMCRIEPQKTCEEIARESETLFGACAQR